MARNTAPDGEGDAQSPNIHDDVLITEMSRRHIRDLIRDQHVAVYMEEGQAGVSRQGENPYAYFYINGGEYSGSDYRKLLAEQSGRRPGDRSDPPRPLATYNVALESLQRLMDGEMVHWGNRGGTEHYVKGTEISDSASGADDDNE